MNNNKETNSFLASAREILEGQNELEQLDEAFGGEKFDTYNVFYQLTPSIDRVQPLYEIHDDHVTIDLKIEYIFGGTKRSHKVVIDLYDDGKIEVNDKKISTKHKLKREDMLEMGGYTKPTPAAVLYAKLVRESLLTDNKYKKAVATGMGFIEREIAHFNKRKEEELANYKSFLKPFTGKVN